MKRVTRRQALLTGGALAATGAATAVYVGPGGCTTGSPRAAGPAFALVAVDGGEDRLSMLLAELIPQIRSQRSRVGRGLWGWSMGGSGPCALPSRGRGSSRRGDLWRRAVAEPRRERPFLRDAFAAETQQ